MTIYDPANDYWPTPANGMRVCPECGQPSPADQWAETEVYCEDCGEHPAVECPRCYERYDHVWGAEQLDETTRKWEAAQ